MTNIRKTLSRALIALLILLGGGTSAVGQIINDAIRWSHQLENQGADMYTLVFTAKLKPNWHLYGTQIPPNGPQPTALLMDELAGAELIGELTPMRKAIEKYDEIFEMNISYYEGEIRFRQTFRVNDPKAFRMAGAVRYMVCDDTNCLPPSTYEFAYKASDLGATPATTAEAAPEEPSDPAPEQVEAPEQVSIQMTNVATPDLWRPVIEDLKVLGDKSQEQASSSPWMIFLFGFLGGLMALLTPCVWPMIPMTVSFFLKRTKDRSKAIRDALTYGLSIVVIYLVLGLAVTALFGASALNDLSTHAVFNIIFFLLLVFFAASFFGAFEIVLPAKWTNKIDQKADSTTGLLSILFMAFTLALVSFSCTGPIIGTLLVQAATMGSLLGPAIGMLGFSIALALPFALFAIFPSMLQSMPKSGGWLNSVKVVLAFLELALSLKFLSVADQAYKWGILDRETFLALWIVIFFLLGLYLIGKLRFAHDSPSETTSVPGLFLGIISMAFAVYMVPGLWGAPLKSISAFTPLSTTQDFNLYEGNVHAKFDDYEEGMAYAKRVGKPVLLDFSGYGCVNCRKMEASVWIQPQVKQMLEEDYVLITLMVDDKTSLPEVLTVGDNGKEIKLRTVGDKWSYFQRHKFGANAQPYYIALDHDGSPLTTSRGYDENVQQYISFLASGLDAYKSKHQK